MEEIRKENQETKQEQPDEKVQTNEQGHLAKIKVGDKEYKVVNTSTMIEIIVHKLENGTEISQVVAHEFMMTDHKRYMVKLLTEAINTVMKATKRKSMIKLASKAMFNKIRREINQNKGSSFGGGNGKIRR